MDAPLDPIEVRVLGALAEKALATPDAYPLSLNALRAACNQKTARDPVMALSEDDVAAALDRLLRRGLAGTSSGAGSRVAKYRHLLDHAFGLDEAELAALAVLMLRGPQTAGEVRTRTGRMYGFASLDEAEGGSAGVSLGARNRWPRSFRFSPAGRSRASPTSSAGRWRSSRRRRPRRPSRRPCVPPALGGTGLRRWRGASRPWRLSFRRCARRSPISAGSSSERGSGGWFGCDVTVAPGRAILCRLTG